MPQQAETHDLAALLVSDHVQYVKARREDFSRSFFPLSDAEIRALEANGNSGAETVLTGIRSGLITYLFIV